MKQTAVEWLVDTLYPYLNKEDKEYTDVLFNKAKEMDKEQKIAFAENYETKVYEGMLKSAEQYYNETFKSE